VVGVIAVVMAVGTLIGRPGFGFIYHMLLGPLGVLRPDVVADNPEPHRFAQGFGAAILFGGTIALLTGLELLGWVLVWLVIALAALNLLGGFCVGCAMYYWLNRMHVPGFSKTAPPGTIPGMRPRMEGK